LMILKGTACIKGLPLSLWSRRLCSLLNRSRTVTVNRSRSRLTNGIRTY
jgi:hypothetical protein